LLLEAAQALKGVVDRVDSLLKDDLLRRVLELLAGKPAPMRQRPMAAAAPRGPRAPRSRRRPALTAHARQTGDLVIG
jgi:hypothetical protein